MKEEEKKRFHAQARSAHQCRFWCLFKDNECCITLPSSRIIHEIHLSSIGRRLMLPSPVSVVAPVDNKVIEWVQRKYTQDCEHWHGAWTLDYTVGLWRSIFFGTIHMYAALTHLKNDATQFELFVISHLFAHSTSFDSKSLAVVGWIYLMFSFLNLEAIDRLCMWARYLFDCVCGIDDDSNWLNCR